MDGADLMVTHNLHTALQYLRQKDDSRLFWIDAICINQMDLKERSAQVLKMKDIYEKASEVVIWLGVGSDETTLAMSFIRKIWNFWVHSVEVLGMTESMVLDICQSNLAALFDDCHGSVDFRPLDSFKQLLLREWFERVWVIQEATTPLNTKLLQCGDATVSWDAFIITANFISSLMVRPDLQAYFAAARPLDHQATRRLFNMEKQRKSPHILTNLLETLANYRYFYATDPRDKIYALRGLATGLAVDELVPDYSLDFRGVYVQAAKYFILKQASFDCLGYCKFSLRDTNLPSWVPDWSNPSTSHPLAKYETKKIYDSEPRHLYQITAVPAAFFADHSRTPYILNDQILVVSGFCVDVIHEVKPCNLLEPTDTKTDSIMSWVLGKETDVYKPTGETIPKAFSQTLVADVAKNGGFRGRGYSVSLDYWQSVSNFIEPPSDRKYRQEWGSLLFASSGRSILLSRHGYIGLGDDDSEPGDHICLFHGASVLYVLRPKGSSFQFISECYVHGLMDGEAVELLNNGTCKVREFVIE